MAVKSVGRLEMKLAIGVLLLIVLTAASAAALTKLWGNPLRAAILAVLIGVLPALYIVRATARPQRRVLRVLVAAASGYRDGDFNLSFTINPKDELAAVLHACNDLGRALRERHSALVQRELLLDTATQNSPMAVVLVDAQQRVVYDNVAARRLFDAGRSLEGRDFPMLLQKLPEAFREAVQATGDCLFLAEVDGIEEMFHFSPRSFLLRSQPHRLYLLNRLTRELSRQEVATWKKLIRVLSHELNNSLAPIASMADTGTELIRRGDTLGITTVLDAIGERAKHLHQFIGGYAAFAKLPAPRPERIDWAAFLHELTTQQRCTVVDPVPSQPGWFDRPQLEQALLNLLRNAHEAGGPPEAVELSIVITGEEQRIEVRDRGPGMSAAVLVQALLPFYSTKRQGTGLGLALAREIAEAHGGWIRLSNRDSGGLCVALGLPLKPPTTGNL